MDWMSHCSFSPSSFFGCPLSSRPAAAALTWGGGVVVHRLSQLGRTATSLVSWCTNLATSLASGMSIRGPTVTSTWASSGTTSSQVRPRGCVCMFARAHGLLLVFAFWLSFWLSRAGVQLPEDGPGWSGLPGWGVRLRQHYALREKHFLQVGSATEQEVVFTFNLQSFTPSISTYSVN